MLTGYGAPASGLGIAGDVYYDILNKRLYLKLSAVAWDGGIQIVYSNMLSGSADPSSTLGTIGDFYLNTTTNILWGPKPTTTGGWVVNSVHVKQQPAASVSSADMITSGASPTQAEYNALVAKFNTLLQLLKDSLILH
jgi:hypothetical protein